MSQQILFTSEDQSKQTFRNYYAARNGHLVAALKDFLGERPGFGCLYLYGPRGAGKTHLLKSAVNAAGDRAGYLDIRDCPVNDFSPGGDLELLAVDNLEPGMAREQALLMLYESARQAPFMLVFASLHPPRAAVWKLQDLVSRLAGGQVFEIRALDDDEKVAALKFRAGLRGFELSDEVVKYVISRYPRDFGSLFELLDIIDNASLTRQRRITVPFIRQLEKH